MNVIDEFMERYLREYDFYLEAARLCAQQCETGLERLGIRAIVTHRAKRPDRLRSKLLKRNEEKKYKSVQDVYEDIVDLAGVRIALYFPGDRPEVQKFVEAQFQVNLTKTFPENPTPKAGKRFSGYWATHHRVQIKDTSLEETQKRFSQAGIEIQVASVLMHAWAEVEHDLVYKPFSGELSQTEYDILDELNGLVLSGEIALETLQRAVKTRVSGRTKQPFNNHYELAAYLYSFAAPTALPSASEPVLGRVDILFRFLQLAGLNRPEFLKRYLVDLDPDTERRSVTDQITDRILAGRADQSDRFLQLYFEARRSVGARSPYDPTGVAENTEEIALGYFMSRWIAFEAAINYFVQQNTSSRSKQARYRPIMEAAKALLDAETFKSLYWVRQVRNIAVHAVEPVSPDQLISAGKVLEAVLDRLIQSAPSDLGPALAKVVGSLRPLPPEDKVPTQIA